jgi:hypothetical protein
MTTSAAWPKDYGANTFDTGFADAANSAVWTDLSGVSGTPTVANDSTVTFNGSGTTKVSVPAGSTRIEIGVSSGIAKPLGWNGSCLWALRFPSAGIARLAVVSNAFNPFLGDGTYTNYWIQSFAYPPDTADYAAINADEWVYIVTQPDRFSTGGGSPSIAGTTRGKIRINLTAGTAFDFHVGYWGPVPRGRPKIMCIFDDAYDSFYTDVVPEAITYGVPCAVSVPSSLIGTPSFMSLSELQSVVNDASGLFECLNHSTDDTSFLDSGSDVAATVARFNECRRWLIDNGLDTRGSSGFAVYVGGEYNSALAAAMRSAGFMAARGVSTRKIPPTHYSQGVLRRMALPILSDCSAGASATPTTVLAAVDKAIQYRSDGILMFHDITTGTPTGLMLAKSDMTTIFQGLQRRARLGLCDLVLPSKWYRGLTQPALVA